MLALERDKGPKGSPGTRFRENSMEERAIGTYKTTALLRQDCDQFEIRIRQTCMRIFICLLGVAFVGFGTLAVLLAIGFGWIG